MENNVKFQNKDNIFFRPVFSAVVLTCFLLFAVFVVAKDFVDSATESIVYMNFPEKRNPGLKKLHKQFFNYSILTNLDLEAINCKLMMTSKSKWQSSDANSTFMQAKVDNKLGKFKYTIINANADSDIINLDSDELNYGNELIFESLVSVKCDDPNSIKGIDQSQFKVALVSSTTLSVNLLNKTEPFNVVKDGNGEVFDINNNIHCMKEFLNSYDLTFKPTVILNDDDYFRIISLSKDSYLEAENHSKDTIRSDIVYLGKSKTMISIKNEKIEEVVTRKNPAKYYSDDVLKKVVTDEAISLMETKNMKLIGMVNYLIDLKGEIIIRKYPKFKNMIPILLCILLLVVLALRMAFSFYDHNSIYLEHINSFYTFTISNSYIEQENGKEDDDLRSTGKSDSENQKSINIDVESTEMADNYKIMKKPLLEASFMKFPINETVGYGNLNDEESKINQTNTKLKSFQLEKLNSKAIIASPDKAETFRISSSNMFKGKHKSKSESEFQFTSCDLLRFLFCRCFDKTRIKMSLYRNCKNQLTYYLNPEFYFRMCAANEDSACIGRNSLEYSATISPDYKHYQVCRRSNNFADKNGKRKTEIAGNDIRVSFVCRDN